MLSNFDLETLCRHYNVPLKGIHLKDMLPNRPVPGFTIINLDSTYDEDGPVGSHWTALFCDQREAIYMDSFGAPAPAEVDAWLKTSMYAKYGYNGWIIQNKDSDVCGFYCLAFGIFCSRNRWKNETLGQCANRFSHLFKERQNEAVLRKWLLNIVPVHPLVRNKCK